MVMYDITNEASFHHLPGWLENIDKVSFLLKQLVVGRSSIIINDRSVASFFTDLLITKLAMESYRERWHQGMKNRTSLTDWQILSFLAMKLSSKTHQN